jgi:hypothetical protein
MTIIDTQDALTKLYNARKAKTGIKLNYDEAWEISNYIHELESWQWRLIMRTAAKVDRNQPEIVEALRGIPGCTVTSTAAMGKGFPDLVVGWMGRNYLMEIKDGELPPSKRRLTPDEKKFHHQWAGQVTVVNSVEEAFAVLNLDWWDEDEPDEIPF